MKRIVDYTSWPAEAMTLWPATTAGLFWVEHRGGLDLMLFFVSIVSGGVSYVYVARLRRAGPLETSKTDPPRGEINPLYLLSEGTLLDFVEVWSPHAASALPRKDRSIVVVILSLSVVALSFLWLWIRSSVYVFRTPEPTTAIAVMGMLAHLFVVVLLGSAVLARGDAAAGD